MRGAGQRKIQNLNLKNRYQAPFSILTQDRDLREAP
jgi:hypothetical protein